MADSKESVFQQDIINAMVEQGWLTGTSAAYDRTTALYTQDLTAYFAAAHPDRWEKFCKNNPTDPEGVLIQKTVRAPELQGTLDVLRHGFNVPRGKD